MPRTQWEVKLEALRRDNRSGAEEILAKALDLLIEAIAESSPSGVLSYKEWLLRISRQIVAAQPSMGVLFRLVNDMLWACDGVMNSTEMRQKALDFLQDYQQQQETTLQAVIDQAAQYLANFASLMTYSRSSTVARVFTTMAERNIKPRIYCSEGRPMLEGQTLASELSWAGLDVILGIDMALFGWLGEVRALVIGADSIGSAGLVNKVGTAALMHAAMEQEIPRIVVCSSLKFLPEDYLVGQSLRSGAPEEIMPVSSENITVRNVYFDVTPLELVSVVINEKGPLEYEELLQELAQIRTYPGLRGR
ncbi:MAG: hypothetical protein J7M05_10535 [Anaerolineae bacterium]|nr:hypothetical protein [Anaerolineae bacterium]